MSMEEAAESLELRRVARDWRKALKTSGSRAISDIRGRSGRRQPRRSPGDTDSSPMPTPTPNPNGIPLMGVSNGLLSQMNQSSLLFV